jgi:Putative metallopeptidase
MLNSLKGLSGLLLASLLTIGDLPGVFPQKVAQAQTATSTLAKRPAANLIANHQTSGQINVVYGETTDPISAALIRGYQRYGFFEKIGGLITSEINLPQDITVALADCGMANAAYVGKEHTIVICNELTKENYQVLLKNGYGKDEALKTAIFASVFTFFHETGHMLIHELNLAAVGKEEDVADQFAAFFLLSNDPSEDKAASGEMVLAAAKIFALESTEPGNHDYQDEHGLSLQRSYTLVCTLYGANPEKYSTLVSKLDYSESRLQRCQSDAETIVSAWQRLLEPHLKS